MPHPHSGLKGQIPHSRDRGGCQMPGVCPGGGDVNSTNWSAHKPLKRSNLILKRCNQWSNSKLCLSRSSSQVRLTTSEIIWHLRFLTARGHIHENILLDKFLYLSVLSSAKNWRFLNDKPLWRSNLILQWCNQWSNSKLCGSRSISQVRLTTSEICDFSQPVGIFTRTFSLFLFLFICIDIFHTKQTVQQTVF